MNPPPDAPLSTSSDVLLLDRIGWEIRPADGVPLRGDVRFLAGTQPTSAVVICHGFKGFRRWGFFPPLARALARRGHAAVSFDFSRNGVGGDGVDFSALERFAENTHSRNVDEIRLVLDAVAAGRIPGCDGVRVGLFGHSRGGGEAVLAAAEDPRVEALVTWAAIASVHRWPADTVERWRRGETVLVPNARTGQAMPMGPGFWRDVERSAERLDIGAAAARIGAPWLIVHGDADASVSVDDAHALFAAAGEAAELAIVADADHTFGAKHPWAGAPPELQTAARLTAEWFDPLLSPRKAVVDIP